LRPPGLHRLFKASLGYIVRLYLRKKKTQKTKTNMHKLSMNEIAKC
jgi:methylphosphotriester-DNA--protein-cysteine methyltransferase